MKKFFKMTGALCLLCAFILVGCENSTQIFAASFSDISVSGADNYGVGVKFQSDKRLEGKYVDVQVKSNKVIENMTIWEDNGEKFTFGFEEKDSWKSITTIFVNGKDKPNTEEFEQFDKVNARRYLFSAKEKVELTFRVVVGDSVDNAQKTGKVLVSSEPISKEFKLKVEGKNNENLDD